MSKYDEFDNYFGANKFEFNDDYTNKTGVDLIQDPQAVGDVRSYYEAKGETFSSDKDLWDRFYKDRRWRDTNSISMGLGAAEYALAGDSQKLQARLSKMWRNAPSRGGIFEKVTDYGLAGVLDPINLIGGAGMAKKGAQAYKAGIAAMQTTAQASKAGMKAGAIQGAKTEAALNAGVGAGFDAASQAAEIQQGVSDEFDPVRTAMSGALDATIGGVVGLGVGAYQGNKAVKELRNWQKSSPLGQSMTTRTARLESEIEKISTDLDQATNAGEREDLTEILTSLRTELNDIEKLGVDIDDMDAKLDGMASDFQALAKTDPEGARKKFEADYQKILKERDDKIAGADLDDLVDPATPPRQGPKQEDVDVDVDVDEATGDTTRQSGDKSPSEAGTKTTTTEVDDPATGTKTTTKTEEPVAEAEVEAEAEESVAPTPYKWGGKKPSKAQQLESEGKITVDEVGRLVTQGILEVTENGNIKQRYGKGDTAYSRITSYINRRDEGVQAPSAGVAPKAEPKGNAPDNAATATAAPKSTPKAPDATPEEPDAPADVDLDSQAREAFENLYDLGMASGGEWSVMVPRILGSVKKTLPGQVYRRVAEKFGAVVELEKMGKRAPNAKEVDALRTEFLNREVTTPDVEGGTVPRSADRSAKAGEVLEKGDVAAGRGPDGKIQGILRPGFKVGEDATVSNRSDVPQASLFNSQAAVARAAEDANMGKQKPIYEFTASGRESPGRVADGKRLEKGQIAYYVPNAKKYFTSKKNAEKATGLRGDKKPEPIFNTPTEKVTAPQILTDAQFEAERAKITNDFINDPSKTTDDLDEALQGLDRRTPAAAEAEAPSKPEIASAETDVPDDYTTIPATKGSKVIALVPRSGDGVVRIMSQSQIDSGKTIKNLLGKSKISDYYVGYLPTSARTAKSNIERWTNELEPWDVSDAPDTPEVEAFNDKLPLNISELEGIRIEFDELTQAQRMAYFTARKLARMPLGDYPLSGEITTLQQMQGSILNLREVHAVYWNADNADLGEKITVAGQEVELTGEQRAATMAGLNQIIDTYAPNGIEYPIDTVKGSIDKLNKIYARTSVKTRKNLEKMMRAFGGGDENATAPLFAGYSSRGGAGYYRGTNNGIYLNQEMHSKTGIAGTGLLENTSITPEFVTAHEMGHWAYVNLMTHKERAEFWDGVVKQYADGDGKFREAGIKKYLERMPFGKGQADWNKPNELFANQFALFLHHKHDIMMYPDKTYWEKFTKRVREVWGKMSNKKSVYDETLTPMFNKMLLGQEEKTRVAYAMPVSEPATSLGRVLRTRYSMLFDHRTEALSRLQDGDMENFAAAMGRIADEFNSMATTEKGAMAIAAKRGEPYNPEYTGVLNAVKPIAGKMRKAARVIKGVTGRHAVNVGQKGEAEISGSAYFENFEEELKIVMSDEGIMKTVDDVMETLNEAFQSVEFGDIPEYSVGKETANLRRTVGMTKILKSQAMKKAMRAFFAEKARNKKFAGKMIEAAKKRIESSASEKTAGTPDINPDEVDVDTAIRLFQDQIDEKGNLTKLGKRLAERVVYHLNTRGVAEYRRRTYSGLNNAELFLRYSQAVEKSNTELMKKLEFEIQIRNAPIEVESDAVNIAAQNELRLSQGVSPEVGVPANSPYKLRQGLMAITHRTDGETKAARTMAYRQALLGHDFGGDVGGPEFESFRKEIRQLASNVTKRDDITQTIRSLTLRLINSKAVSAETVADIRRSAAEYGYEADEFITRVVLEDVDSQSDGAFTKSVLDDAYEMKGTELDDGIASIRADMREALSYVLNGLVPSDAARRRFSPLFVHGDMMGKTSAFDASSPALRFDKDVPSEFAEDYAADVIENMSPAGRMAVQKFTGSTEPTPFYIEANNRSDLDGMVFVSSRPTSSVSEMRDGMGGSEQIQEVLDGLSFTRNQIKNLASSDDVVAQRIQAAYSTEKVLRKELERLGGIDNTMVTPVFIRDTQPLRLSKDGMMRDDNIKAVLSALKIKENPELPSRVAQFESLGGLHDPEKMFEMLSTAAGGVRKLRSTLREAGYTSIEIGRTKVVLRSEDAKPVRSTFFNEDNQNNTSVREGASNINAHMMTEMMTGDNNARIAYEEASHSLELSGVPSKVVDVLAKVKRGRTIDETDGRQIRKASRIALIPTNAQTMRKARMPFLADFFEPTKGGGGHFERVSSNMGKFIMPLQRKMRDLPDAGNFLQRWLNDGLIQMFDATPGSQSARGFASAIMGSTPNRRSNQPMSHSRIYRALTNEASVGNMRAKERDTYDFIRSYLDQAVTKLRAAGVQMGNIQRNYFPQVWRKDLIENDREGFIEKLTEYFIEEARVDHRKIGKEEAGKKAKDVADRLIAKDGMADEDNLIRSNGAGVEDNFDFQRMIRLDEPWASKFKNPLEPTTNLSSYLEQDLLAVMTKYSDALERRLDVAKHLGANGQAYHDYLNIQAARSPGDEISRMLRGDVVMRRERNEINAEGKKVTQTMKDVAFFAPFKEEYAADKFTAELMEMARKGTPQVELRDKIMAQLDTTGEPSQNSKKMKDNFYHRANAISAALSDSDGFLTANGDRIAVSRQNIEHAEGFFDASMRHSIDPDSKSGSLRAASKWLRSVNAVTLLGFTTLSSMGDLVLPLIRSGDFMSFQKGLRKFMQDPVAGSAYRDMIRNVGAASENIVHQRMTKAFGVDNTKFTSGFFATTLLTGWTDMMRDISAAVAYEHFRSQSRIAREAPNTRQGRIAKQILNEAGLQELYKSNMNIESIMRSGGESEHPYREQLASSIVKFTNQSIFTPNANDQPLWAQTPGWQIVFQLKSFPLMMTRLGRDVVKDAVNKGSEGERRLAPLLYFAGLGPMFGSGVVFAKDVVQGRGGEENREFAVRDRALTDKFTMAEEFGLKENADQLLGWYVDGLMQMGGLGLIGQLMYDSAAQIDNGAYGKWRVAELLGGPSLGLFSDAFEVASGAADATLDAFGAESTNSKERSAVREILGRAPILGGVTAFREGGTDLIAGEAES